MSDQVVSTPVSNIPSETPVTTQTTAGNTSTPAATAQEAAAVVADPNASKAAKVEAKKYLKKLTLKVDGQEFEENLPFEIPDDPKAIEYMRRELQMGKMGQKRAQEKAVLEKELTDFLDLLKTNPREALSDPNIGVDIKKMVTEYMEEEIANAAKSPEQLELEKLRKEMKSEKEKAEKEKKERETQEQQRMAEKYAQEYDTQISAALDANKIPRSEIAVKQVLAWLEFAVENNKDITVDDVIPFIKEDLTNGFRKHAEALPDDQLESFFGEELINRLRKKAVAKIKQANNPAIKAPAKVANTGKTTEAKKDEAPKQTFKQFFKI